MNEYELLYIVTPRRSADEVPQIVEWVEGLIGEAGGEVLTSNNWGRRRLAYPINGEFEGTYVLTTLRMPPAAAAGLEYSISLITACSVPTMRSISTTISEKARCGTSR